MNIKKFNEYNYIKENILDEDDDDYEYERKWEVKVNGKHESWWEYKHDAIDQILEFLENNGDDTGLDEYEDEDGEEIDKNELADILSDLNEIEFYEKLDEIKDFVGYEGDIKLINIADEDEIEFLED